MTTHDRAERLARELRENLKRRKAQARAAADDAQSTPSSERSDHSAPHAE